MGCGQGMFLTSVGEGVSGCGSFEVLVLEGGRVERKSLAAGPLKCLRGVKFPYGNN